MDSMTAIEVLEAIVREAELNKSSKQWTIADDGSWSCMTVRVPTALVNRAKEAIEAEKSAA